MYDLNNYECNNKGDIILFIMLLVEFMVYLKEINGVSDEVIERETIMLFLGYLIQIALYFYLVKMDLDKRISLTINAITFVASVEGLIIIKNDGDKIKVKSDF